MLSNAFHPFCALSAQWNVYCVHPKLPGCFRVWVTVWVRPRGGPKITTHAPREGGRPGAVGGAMMREVFQSTPPARGATFAVMSENRSLSFQSTPPARGATSIRGPDPGDGAISIHAPREGGDAGSCPDVFDCQVFQSTPPARGATIRLCAGVLGVQFQSTPPARGATLCFRHLQRRHRHFNPRPPRGGRP